MYGLECFLQSGS